MSEWFVIVINNEGVPNQLTKHFSFDEATAYIVEFVRDKQHLTEDDKEYILEDGQFDCEDGISIYVICCDN